MVERLGEQLLTDVNAWSKTTLLSANLFKFGVLHTVLLYACISNPPSSAINTRTFLRLPLISEKLKLSLLITWRKNTQKMNKFMKCIVELKYWMSIIELELQRIFIWGQVSIYNLTWQVGIRSINKERYPKTDNFIIFILLFFYFVNHWLWLVTFALFTRWCNGDNDSQPKFVQDESWSSYIVTSNKIKWNSPLKF